MAAAQVTPSEFNFNMPKIPKPKKTANREKDKWVDRKPFFGGFNMATK